MGGSDMKPLYPDPLYIDRVIINEASQMANFTKKE